MGLCPSTAGGRASIPGPGAKILHAVTRREVWPQKKKRKERKKERSSRFTIRKTKLFIINKIHLNTKHPCGGEFPNQKGPSDCQGDVYRSPGTLEELMMITETVRSKRLNRS